MQLVKSVLDEAFCGIQAKSENAKDVLIRGELARLRLAYANLTVCEREPIDYSDPTTRFAYIYAYTVAHADYIRQVIAMSPNLQVALGADAVRVACLGGGPGSDLLGILKYMIATGASGNCLSCYLFDRERAWAVSWSDVARLMNAPFRVFTTFAHFDATDPKTWSSYGKFFRSDVLTLSYFISELYTIRSLVEPFFDQCLSQMRSGALLLFVDNNSPCFVNWFDQLGKRHRLRVLLRREDKLAFSCDEEKTDLGEYFDKFGWPKRESDVAYRVMIKD